MMEPQGCGNCKYIDLNEMTPTCSDCIHWDSKKRCYEHKNWVKA